MELQSFRVLNFRSITDSGTIDVSKITALLGRNESGKTNLILALQSLNPPEGFRELEPIKDFPRHRRLTECTPETKVLNTTWQLTSDERSELTKILPRAANVEYVEVGRRYGATRWINLTNIKKVIFDPKRISQSYRKIKPAIDAVASKTIDENHKSALEAAGNQLEVEIEPRDDKDQWAEAAKAAFTSLRQILANVDMELSSAADKSLDHLEDYADEILGAQEAEQNARNFIASCLPVFIFLDDYPELNGEHNISEYLARKNAGDKQLTDSDRYFEKLCKVAGLDAGQLETLAGGQESETRNQLANRAGAIVTSELRRLWRDRQLTVRFDLDGAKMNTLVSDPTASYPVEVNFDERSRGFKWFFSFYITFSADTQGGEAQNAILLLDEPGLYLHAMSQADLLQHFKQDFDNQILYTTHSPFMVPTDNLDAVRTVNISEQTGTTVTNDPTGDTRTLFPLQSALGYNIAQSMFVGQHNLVIEGVTDYWMLSSISEYLADLGKTSLNKRLTLTPAGGAQKVSYMVALLTSENLDVLVLLDREGQSVETKDQLVKSKLVREDNVVFVSEAINDGKIKEADIEDLLDTSIFLDLVRESYSKELKSKQLNLNAKIPRIAKRVELGLSELEIEFHKSRPARLFLKKMSSEPGELMTPDTVARFEKLFGLINERFDNHLRRKDKPFS